MRVKGFRKNRSEVAALNHQQQGQHSYNEQQKQHGTHRAELQELRWWLIEHVIHLGMIDGLPTEVLLSLYNQKKKKKKDGQTGG